MIDGNKLMEIIFKVGSLAGLLSFLWLITKDIIKFYRAPRLVFTFDKKIDLRTFQFQDNGWVRKFATLHVRNTRNKTAKRCVANLKITKKSSECTHLECQYALHWAGIDYSTHTTGAQPIDLGSELIRLDVVFTQQGQGINGCWIAIPFTLSGDIGRNQAYLPPGEYEAEIDVKCENGKGHKANFKIISPTSWDKLEMEAL